MDPINWGALIVVGLTILVSFALGFLTGKAPKDRDDED